MQAFFKKHWWWIIPIIYLLLAIGYVNVIEYGHEYSKLSLTNCGGPKEMKPGMMYLAVCSEASTPPLILTNPTIKLIQDYNLNSVFPSGTSQILFAYLLHAVILLIGLFILHIIIDLLKKPNASTH